MLTQRQLNQRRSNTDCPIPDCDQLHLPNVPLMRKILDRIREDPNSWNQSTWVQTWTSWYLDGGPKETKTYHPETDSVQVQETTEPLCGTAFCIAGHATMLSEDPLRMVTRVKGMPVYTSITKRGYSAAERAAHELGLTDSEASYLFAGGNNFEQVKRTMSMLAKLINDTL